MANLKLTANNIINGSAVLQTYLRGGVNVPVNPVREYVLIDTGYIPSGNAKIIDLALLGYEVAIDSIWTLSRSQPTRGGVTVQIVPADDVGISLHEFELSGDCNCMTLPFIVLDHRYKLRIIPDNNVDNILLYAYQVHRIDYLGVTNLPS
jgi:hypothetical protein